MFTPEAPEPLKQYYAHQQKTSIPYKIATPKATNPKLSVQSIHSKHPPKFPTKPSKPTTINKTPPVPIGILRKVIQIKPLPPQKGTDKIFGKSKFEDSSIFTSIGLTTT